MRSRMKGMSLALETIVILILAMTVLVAMTFFFNKEFGSGTTTLALLNGQRESCSAYVSRDSRCSSQGHQTLGSSANTDGQMVLKKIIYYCSNLGTYKDCRKPSSCSTPEKCSAMALYECVKQCCAAYCPGGQQPPK